MTTPSIDAQVRLDTHPSHPSAVTATLTGTQHRTAHALLTTHGFEPVNEHTLMLARIDHEEPYWAQQTAQKLADEEGVTVEIRPRLRAAIDEEWTWANYPMHWCTRQEIREVSHQANQLYEDIRSGRLVIHAHAEDGGGPPSRSVRTGAARASTSTGRITCGRSPAPSTPRPRPSPPSNASTARPCGPAPHPRPKRSSRPPKPALP
ncbi:hypothetical protein [Streptomyces sp. NPDC127033]|uniref:hypothetical protein n=1 Tax=Streptomyces sp. NPDC127033 TaxID=3347110 RepID=UPI00364CCC44